MTKIYLTDLDEEGIVDFVKGHNHDNTNELFKDKARKECLWERFANSHKQDLVCSQGWEMDWNTS